MECGNINAQQLSSIPSPNYMPRVIIHCGLE